jgi:hypothetical protein
MPGGHSGQEGREGERAKEEGTYVWFDVEGFGDDARYAVGDVGVGEEGEGLPVFPVSVVVKRWWVWLCEGD